MKSAFEPAFEARRTTVATALVGALLAVLVVRLYVLQVLRGEEYEQKSASNFVQERRIPHARGVITDQAGRILADNRPSHDVYMTVAFLPDSTKALQRLFAPLKLRRAELVELDQRVLTAVNASDVGRAVVLLRDNVDADACTKIEHDLDDQKENARARGTPEDLRGVVIEHAPDDGDEPGACRILVDAREFPSRAAVFRRVGELVGLEPPEVKERVDQALARSSGLGRFKQTLLLEDIGFDAYARLSAAAALGELPGIDVVDSQKRRYRNKTRAAHVLGYLNEISPTEFQAKKDAGYFLGDFIGRRGVEQSHETELRGRDGIEKVVVDAKGRSQGPRIAEEFLGDDRIDPSVAGKSLVLSLDDDMQRAAEESFGGVAGSVVALEVKTGFVLAMASFPTYDPNAVTGPWSRAAKKALDEDKLRPWTNKAIQEHYAPGSTFKAITASAGLRNKLIDEGQQRRCPGFFRLGSSVWRCFNRSGHGNIALVRALQYSCDTYFYSLGFDLGPDRLAESARLFGFGSRTGLDLDKETPGVMPDRAYYVRRFGAYTPGLVVNNAIGQGDVAVTPLQLAVAYAALANGGTVYKPQIVRETHGADGSVEDIRAPQVVTQLGLDARGLALMKEALSHVTDPGGTAAGLYWRRDRYEEMSKWLRESGLTIVGKTGTAQVVRLSKSVAHVDAKDVPYLQRDHAWFVGFAPLEDPEVVVVTMTEHGGFGGSTSAPVTAEVLRAWFERVRGHGRYASMPPLPPPTRVFRAPVKKEVVPTEESAAEDATPTAEGPDAVHPPPPPADALDDGEHN